MGYIGIIAFIFLRRSHFFIIIEKKINKGPSQIMFTVIQRWSELENYYNARLKGHK